MFLVVFGSRVKGTYCLQEVRFCNIGYEGPYALTEGLHAC